MRKSLLLSPPICQLQKGSGLDIQAVLSVLADGEFHSGEELGAKLGVSRAAVWKRLQSLESYGLQVESVRGKGYCLPGGLDGLDASVIAELVEQRLGRQPYSIECVSEIDSTNADLMRRLPDGLPAGKVLAAEWQSAGRGRRGRAWISPYAGNLYFSVLWRSAGGAAALEGLSLAVGLAVVEALQTLGVSDLGLKWPNDVWQSGRKIAGILLEMQGDATGECQVVIGIGLNVNMPAAPAEGIDQAWTDVSTALGHNPGRNLILAELLSTLHRVLLRFTDGGFAALKSAWLKHDVCRDQLVRLETGGERRLGICRGVSDQGGLLLEVDGSVQTIYGGEVSLRPVSAPGGDR